MAQITLSQAITWKKTLMQRHTELVALRDKNANVETRFYGADANKEKRIDPVYDIRGLDKLVSQVAREIRKVDDALKAANATLTLPNYDQNDDVLGEVSTIPAPDLTNIPAK